VPFTNNNLAFGISAGRPHSKTVKKNKKNENSLTQILINKALDVLSNFYCWLTYCHTLREENRGYTNYLG
jgi:hypothetical protein